jgi:hypothetical protein
MAPPNDFYNAADDTYTIQLDWVVNIISASEFHCTEASCAHKVLSDDSQYLQLVHLLGGGVFAWLCGRLSMVVMQFPADWYQHYTPTGSLGKA